MVIDPVEWDFIPCECPGFTAWFNPNASDHLDDPQRTGRYDRDCFFLVAYRAAGIDVWN
jgi:hypothetical protein